MERVYIKNVKAGENNKVQGFIEKTLFKSQGIFQLKRFLGEFNVKKIYCTNNKL